jgi:hypothetical protein
MSLFVYIHIMTGVLVPSIALPPSDYMPEFYYYFFLCSRREYYDACAYISNVWHKCKNRKWCLQLLFAFYAYAKNPPIVLHVYILCSALFVFLYALKTLRIMRFMYEHFKASLNEWTFFFLKTILHFSL